MLPSAVSAAESSPRMNINKFREFYFSKGLIWLLLAAGIFLRLRQYAANRSLWNDEATLAINLITRSFSGLISPLEGKLVVPFGFLMSERLAVEFFGPSEYALRLLPLLAGILAMVLFYKVMMKFADGAAVPLGLAIFAVSGPLVYFSSEVKQYSFDVLAAVLILLLAFRLAQIRSLSWSQIFLFGSGGALAVWFSHPAVFLLAGAALVLVLDACRRKQIPLRLVLIFGIWFLSFLTCYFFSQLYLSGKTQAYLNEFWQEGFMPLAPTFKSVQWYVRTFFHTFDNPGGMAPAKLAALVFCAGAVNFVSKKKTVALGLLLMPIILALAASALRIYPFSDRLILFIVPSLIVVVAEGAVVIKSFLDHYHRFLGGIFIVLLLAAPVVTALSYAVKPMSREEIRPVIGYLKARMQPDDTVYVYDGALRAFKYYSVRDHFAPSLIKGIRSHEDLQGYIKDLRQLEGKPRAWVLFSHVWNVNTDEREFLLHYLDTVGTRKDGLEVEGNRMFGSKGRAAVTSVYLYDLGNHPAK
jgi:hypothetical protein